MSNYKPVYESMVTVIDHPMSYEAENGDIIYTDQFTGVRAWGHWKGQVFAALIPMTEAEMINPDLENKVRKLFEELGD